MPRLDCEFRVLTIGNRLPARGQRFLERRLLQIFVDRLDGNAVHPRAQSFLRHEMVRGMRSINRDGLPCGRKCENEIPSQTEWNNRQLFQGRTPPAHPLKRLNKGVYERNGCECESAQRLPDVPPVWTVAR